MRQVFTSPRLENVEGVAKLLTDANIEIKVSDWFRPARHPGALDVTEAAAALRRPLLCVYGMDEKDESICPQLEGKNRRIMPVPGGHHFNKNYAPIEDAILDYLR